MASFLDIGLVQKFDVIFPFLLVLILFYVAFLKMQIFSDHQIAGGVLAVIIALVALTSDSVRAIINAMAPWFIIVIILMTFVFLLLKSIGASDSDLQSYFGKGSVMFIIILIIGVVIGVFSIIDQQVWQGNAEDAVQEGYDNQDVGAGGKEGFFAVMTHPAVLGIIVILLIAAFTISNLSVTSFYKG